MEISQMQNQWKINSRINDQSLPGVVEATNSKWNGKTNNTLVRQWSIRRIQSGNQKKCSIQLVPPDNHQWNLAKRAIQTFKIHFKAILAGVDDSFLMRLCDKLLPQTILTLNLLHQSNVAPTVSAWQYVHRPIDYNKIPLAPMGCAVQIHKSSEQWGTWAANTMNWWYLQTSPEHYWCHQIYVKKTKSERISDTVFFKHRYLTQPTVTPADTVIKALGD
jgi:hypothetical protein